ncbi:hypothetical protein PHYBOEH_008778 [Phytophthora boehmeriae]|uniref:M96 mating-specific protein family n=1 Tax=Phytophthora boehmeriae TaxID=109152 RepID=A0A8T1VY91_9STRA|nr:hypothetical protein PHYBOEH_008778 [Phytophthora boehmeriae]
MTTDDVFLAEVEDFLTSIDLPTFPPAQALDEDVDSDPPTERVAVATLDAQYTRKTPPKHSDELKYELERAKDRKRRSAYRERRRIERETLQQQVRELSKQLSDLENGEDIGRQLSKSAWKMIAHTQYQHRVNAEAYQRQLIAAINTRSALIRDFQAFVRDKCANGADVDDAVIFRPKRMKLEPSNAEFYGSYLGELDTIYAQTDEALQSCDLASIDLDWDGDKWREEGNSGCFTYADKNLVASDWKQTCESLWDVSQFQHRQEDRQPFEQVEDPENTRAYGFRVTTQLKSGQVVSMHLRLVARHYKEDGRGVIVWRSFTEGEGIFTGMHSDETGWVVAIPLPGQPEAGTLVRTCIRHKPMHFSRVITQDSTLKLFTDAVLGMVNEDDLEITSKLGKLRLNDD